MAGSAINSKKKKNKNKNKNKKQSTPTSSTPIEGQSTPLEQEPATPIQEEEDADPVDQTKIPPTGPVGVGAQGATDASLAALCAKDENQTQAVATATEDVTGLNKPEITTTAPLSKSIEHCIHSAVVSRSIDIDSIVKKVAHDVQTEKYKETKDPIQNKSLASTEAIVAEDSTPSNKSDTQANINPPEELNRNDSFKPEVPPKNSVDTNNTSDARIAAAATAAGTGAALAGAGAVAASKTKQKNEERKQESVQPPASSSTPPPISKETVAHASTNDKSSVQTAKLSKHVQHCIDSVVKAPAVDVYDIIQSQKGVKCPEPAAGASNQPAMPSSTKAPDVPKKEKPSERSRNKPSFLKKKNCIIL